MSNVYIIEDITSEQFKIGVSSNVRARLATLQTGNCNNLLLVCQIELQDRDLALSTEHSLHEALKNYRCKGEWFNCSMFDIMLQLRVLGYHDKLIY